MTHAVVFQKEEVTMVRAVNLREHRSWEDWAGIVLGIVIGLTPWFSSPAASQAIMLNAIAIGLLVLALAAFEFVSLRRWEEVAAFACGLWLIASPLMYGYTGALATWHFVLGGLVVLLAALELWQDWGLSESELAKHGR